MTKRPKRPRDPNQLGKLIVDLATGERTEEKPAPLTPTQEARRSGGKAGGRANSVGSFLVAIRHTTSPPSPVETARCRSSLSTTMVEAPSTLREQIAA